VANIIIKSIALSVIIVLDFRLI